MVACLRKKESKDDATGNSRVRREATVGGKVGMKRRRVEEILGEGIICLFVRYAPNHVKLLLSLSLSN